MCQVFPPLPLLEKEKMAGKETIIRSVLCPGGTLPDWMTGSDSSSESSELDNDGGWLKDKENYTKEEEKCPGGRLPGWRTGSDEEDDGGWPKDSNENYSKEEEKNAPPEMPPPSSPPANEEESHGDFGVDEEEEEVVEEDEEKDSGVGWVNH